MRKLPLDMETIKVLSFKHVPTEISHVENLGKSNLVRPYGIGSNSSRSIPTVDILF